MSKVKIYTLASLTPELLYTQYESMKRFIKDEDWEFIVLNNTPIIAFENRKKIKKICKELGLKCKDVRFRSLTSGTAYLVGWALTWLYHRFMRLEKDTIHCIIDSDMFFINEFNFNDYLADNDLVGVHQRRGHVEYIWNGFLFFKGADLPDKNMINWRPATIEGERTDAGGKLYKWMKKNPQLKLKWINNTCHNNVSEYDLLPDSIRGEYDAKFNFQFLGDFIIHYRGASNWSKSSDDFVNKKKAYFDKFMNEVLNNGFRIKENPNLYITKE